MMKIISDESRRLTPVIIWLGCVLILAVTLRIVAWIHTPLVTPDGALYIFQAKAIFYDQWAALAGCAGSQALSPYPFLIAAVYNFCPDWIIAARAINFTFGVAAIIPLYLLLMRFFDYRICAVTVLFVAVSPHFVGAGVDVLKDPGAWFFASLALYFFLSGIEDDRKPLILFSGICFLLGIWARVEIVVLVLVSLGYLIWKSRSVWKTLIFTLPFFVALALVLILAMTGFLNSSGADLSRVDEVLGELRNLQSKYVALETELKNMEAGIDGQAHQALKLFIPEARQAMWLVALGILMNKVFESFLYVFALPFLLGFAQIKRIKNDPRLIYFFLLAMFSLLTLYLFVLKEWVLEYRYVAFFTLSALVFAGVGLEAMVYRFKTRYSVKETLTIIILAVILVFSMLPKNLKPRDADKVVFKEIGEFIVQHEGSNQREIKVSGAIRNQRWVSLYANLNYKGAVCPEATDGNCWEMFAHQDNLIGKLKQRDIKYFLWTEKTWSAKEIDVAKYSRSLKILHVWEHPDTGKMILYEVI